MKTMTVNDRAMGIFNKIPDGLVTLYVAGLVLPVWVIFTPDKYEMLYLVPLGIFVAAWLLLSLYELGVSFYYEPIKHLKSTLKSLYELLKGITIGGLVFSAYMTAFIGCITFIIFFIKSTQGVY